MDVDAKSVSVTRASEKLRKFVSGGNGGHTAEEILQAALDFKERIAPKIEEVNTLRQELEEYRALFTIALRDATNDAEKERDNAIRERDQALAWAEVSVKELSGVRTELSLHADGKTALEMYNSELVAENTSLKGKHDTLTEELKKANANIGKYQSSIIHLKERVRRQEEKISDLNERTNSLQEQTQVMNSEEEPTERIQVSQPRKRPRLQAQAGFTPTDLAFDDDSLFFEGMPKSLLSKEIPPGNNLKRKAKLARPQPLQNLNCLASGPKRTIRIPKH
ncbi:hypothetical protein BDZ89DRAFT_760083 [Hymenopellis radicata]|nr:hypothetical protein BDZ89DRAFT_760083 [Hymenopellis radicata]